jgi:transposase InsO family protein
MLSYTQPISIKPMLRRPVESAQYTSSAYGELLTAHHVRQSVGRPGTCWDKDHAAYCTSFRLSG